MVLPNIFQLEPTDNVRLVIFLFGPSQTYTGDEYVILAIGDPELLLVPGCSLTGD